MVIESSKNEPCTEIQSESEIHININGQRNDTIRSTKHEFCSRWNDIFQLYSSDGFCLESLFVNEKEILGTNSTQNNCGDIGMLTSDITIKDGAITYFECKGNLFRGMK